MCILDHLIGKKIKNYHWEENKFLTIYFEDAEPFQIWFITDVIFNTGENTLREDN